MTMSDVLKNVTKEQLTHAFEIWETGVRNNPSSFHKYEDVLKRPILQNADERASYFFQLLLETQEKAE